jgi:hypothetical protein
MAGLWNQADIDALKIAVSSGVLTVTYAGPPSRTLTYQNLSEMRKLLAEMVADVAAQSGTATYRLAAYKSGFGR